MWSIKRYPPGGDLVGTTAKERRRGVIERMGFLCPSIRHLSVYYTTKTDLKPVVQKVIGLM